MSMQSAIMIDRTTFSDIQRSSRKHNLGEFTLSARTQKNVRLVGIRSMSEGLLVVSPLWNKSFQFVR